MVRTGAPDEISDRLSEATALLDGEGDVKWEAALLFDHREAIDGGKFFLATNYRGPRPDHPRLTADED